MLQATDTINRMTLPSSWCGRDSAVGLRMSIGGGEVFNMRECSALHHLAVALRRAAIRRGCAFIAVIACVTTSSAQSDIDLNRCLVTNHLRSVALVETRYLNPEGSEALVTGTGFLISQDGFLLTTARVAGVSEHPARANEAVQSSLRIEVRVGGAGAIPLSAILVSWDEQLDIALLKLPKGQTAWPVMPVSFEVNPEPGADIYALGFATLGSFVVVEGAVIDTSAQIKGRLRPMLQTNLSVQPGMSGSPAFDELGTVIGLVASSFDLEPGLSFVVTNTFMRDVLSKANVRPVEAGPCHGPDSKDGATDVGVVPECRDPSHGVESWGVQETNSQWSDWRRGGSNPWAWCDELKGRLAERYNAPVFDVLESAEKVRDRSPPFKLIEYKYFCSLRVRSNPTYVLARSQACIK
ncbi:serine protease [Mesorhizobium sp.]|uniref:S1 family peptidase n=1 Tax=Mesorhizobium sp. TaxID=1871066 RepID=UPI00338E81D0